MTCDELRERLVDPSSGAQGGHGPLVEHLHSCVPCRSRARAFGVIERFFTPGTSTEPPTDFDHRVAIKLVATASETSTGSRVRPLPLLAATLAALAVAFALFRGKQTPRPAAAPPPAVPTPAPAEEAPPQILRVGSGPLSLELAQLSVEETHRFIAMADPELLRFADTLARLDPFFPVTPAERPPTPPPPTPDPAAAADSGDALDQRILRWRAVPKAERDLLLSLDDSFRKRPEDERRKIEARWRIVSTLTPGEVSGLRRLVSRLAVLDSRSLSRLTAELKAVREAPPARRAARWQAVRFTRTLTGQEKEIGLKLLSSNS
jgi:hypothetical protein